VPCLRGLKVGSRLWGNLDAAQCSTVVRNRFLEPPLTRPLCRPELRDLAAAIRQMRQALLRSSTGARPKMSDNSWDGTVEARWL
jgi:hypothetical protein